MTFSITGHCEDTDMFGVAITTSSIAVGSRCPHARAGVAAVATQNITDPVLATLVFDLIEGGASAEEAVAQVSAGREHIEYRQLMAVDRNGGVGHFTGEHILGTNLVVPGPHYVAAGNLLSANEVPKAMAAAFEASRGEHLAERLLLALEAGEAAGGEEGPVHSAGLLVHHEQPFALVDLRCDWADEGPIEKLRQLWTDYQPQMQPYLDRAINPAVAPSYGVPGDE